jgi:uncharacterized protein (DUF2267 family)
VALLFSRALQVMIVPAQAILKKEKEEDFETTSEGFNRVAAFGGNVSEASWMSLRRAYQSALSAVFLLTRDTLRHKRREEFQSALNAVFFLTLTAKPQQRTLAFQSALNAVFFLTAGMFGIAQAVQFQSALNAVFFLTYWHPQREGCVYEFQSALNAVFFLTQDFRCDEWRRRRFNPL